MREASRPESSKMARRLLQPAVVEKYVLGMQEMTVAVVAVVLTVMKVVLVVVKVLVGKIPAMV